MACVYIVSALLDRGDMFGEKGRLGCSAWTMDGKSKIRELESYVPGESPGTPSDGGEKKLQTFRPSHWGN